MNPTQHATWRRLATYPLPSGGKALPFTHRLARDNQWTLAYAERVVDEYRKFCFLACHSGHPVTPSDEVDQVWHLHLLYSQDYHERFCDEVLMQPLHHGPTAGGADEDRKYCNWYAKTLASYRRWFGAPPSDIWPAAAERFAARFVRVNRADYVLLDRRRLRRVARPAMAFSLVLVAGSALAAGEHWLAGLGLAAVVGLLLALIVAITVLVKGYQRARQDASQKDNQKDSVGGYSCGGGTGSSKSASDGGDGSGCSGGCGGGCGG